ncbi:MAG: hypothetical protein AVO34_08180 [Firmicutes bacterium ML8_F2]|jgi:cytochrome b561|nr:MAG: hypothetical protein AVO34_08180 [Firmicutes bacterium ML8_F2]
MTLPLFAWFGIIAAVFYIFAMMVITFKRLVKPKLRVKVHRLLAIIGLVLMLIHAAMALSIYL